MKKLLALILLFSSVAFGQYRYDLVPEHGGFYQVPNKEIQNPAYSASVAITTTHEETTCDFAQLTGALSLTAVTTSAFKMDKLVCMFKADGTNRVVTFSTGFTANGTLTVTASTSQVVTFVYNGASWIEQTRQTASSITPSSITTSSVATDVITNKTSGADVSFTVPFIQNGTTTTYTASATVATSELLKGVLVIASGTVTLTLPTASAAGTALNAAAGTSFDFSVLNAASGGTCTVAVNTGITASGFPGTNTLTLANSATVGIARFRLHFISASVATLTRIN